MVVSVIIPTFNRVDHLHQALTSLEGVKVPSGATCETIVVDNSSTDETRRMVEGFVANQPHRFRYVAEPRQGRSFALNTGMKEASGDILAFTDDDCIVPKNWLSAMGLPFQRHPEVGVVFCSVKRCSCSSRCARCSSKRASLFCLIKTTVVISNALRPMIPSSQKNGGGSNCGKFN